MYSLLRYRTYPVICPSIIVAVRRGRKNSVANHKRHYSPNPEEYIRRLQVSILGNDEQAE